MHSHHGFVLNIEGFWHIFYHAYVKYAQLRISVVKFLWDLSAHSVYRANSRNMRLIHSRYLTLYSLLLGWTCCYWLLYIDMHNHNSYLICCLRPCHEVNRYIKRKSIKITWRKKFRRSKCYIYKPRWDIFTIQHYIMERFSQINLLTIIGRTFFTSRELFREISNWDCFIQAWSFSTISNRCSRAARQRICLIQVSVATAAVSSRCVRVQVWSAIGY